MALPFSLPLILDGATGTELQKRGLPFGVCAERWILEHPQAVLDLQRGYARAGSQAILAPTFGANRASLDKYGLSDQTRTYNLHLAELSQIAGEGRVLVGGDLSPTGLFMEPLGDSSFDDIAEIYREQAEALAEAGVDFFAVETQLSGQEALAALKAVRSASDKPVFVSFALSDRGLSFWGETLADLAPDFQSAGADAFGVNCCGDLALIARVLREIHGRTDLPLFVKPNAGLPRVEDGRALYDMTPETLAAAVPDFLAAGARLLGGCCGTTPDHIRAIVRAVNG